MTAPTPDPSLRRTPMSSAAATALFRRALRDVLVFLAALAVVSVVVGGLLKGADGVWAALLGTAVAVLFSGTTVWSMWHTSSSSPTTMIAWVAGSWLVKMIVLVVALVALQGAHFFSRPVFGVVVIVGVLGSVAIDTLTVRRARIPYVEPR